MWEREGTERDIGRVPMCGRGGARTGVAEGVCLCQQRVVCLCVTCEEPVARLS